LLVIRQKQKRQPLAAFFMRVTIAYAAQALDAGCESL
jgi:hypothetical protein